VGLAAGAGLGAGGGAVTWGCDVVERDDEGRVWECLAPANHVGRCFLSQSSGPEYDPGDFGGMST
jgi:hypothetical protein